MRIRITVHRQENGLWVANAIDNFDHVGWTSAAETKTGALKGLLSVIKAKWRMSVRHGNTYVIMPNKGRARAYGRRKRAW